jgi:hypothetical protein
MKKIVCVFIVLATFACKKKSDEPSPVNNNAASPSSSLPKKMVTKSATGKIVDGSVYTYNGNGKLIKEQDLDSNGNAISDSYKTYEYDANGNLVKVNLYDHGATAPETYTYEYSNGLIARITGSVKGIFNYTYEGTNLKTIVWKDLSYPNVDSVVFEGYNSGGRPSTKTDYTSYSSSPRITYFTYDPNFNLVKTEVQTGDSTTRKISQLSTFTSEVAPSFASITTFYFPDNNINPNLNQMDKDRNIDSKSSYYSTCANGDTILNGGDETLEITRNSQGEIVSAKQKEVHYTNNNYSTCTQGLISEEELTITIEY